MPIRLAMKQKKEIPKSTGSTLVCAVKQNDVVQ